jgi:formate hydrogenlyase subunit 3/multisubunit Na+/H+ antiporter MnhD subunit
MASTGTLVVGLIMSLVTLYISTQAEGARNILGKLISLVFYAISAFYMFSSNILDDYSLTLSLVSFTAGVVTTYFSELYSRKGGYPSYLPAIIGLFAYSTSLAYLAPNLVFLIIAWSIMEIVGFILVRVGEEHSTEGSLRAARGYIFASTSTFELTAFTLIVASLPVLAGSSTGILFQGFTNPNQVIVVDSPLLISILLAGFITKSALFPLHFWLPGAHSAAPSPASALLSGLTTPLGFYGLYRLSQVVSFKRYETAISVALLAMGLISILYAGLQALSQRDGKMMLAYTTIMTNGFISTLFSLYIINPGDAFLKLLILLAIVMQMSYKTTLFCDIGVVELSYGTRYVHGLRNLSERLKVSSVGALLSSLTLLGVPGTIGFLVKLASIYYITSKLLTAVDFTTAVCLASAVAYIAFSMLVGLKYLAIYMPTIKRSHASFLEFKSPGTSIQFPVLLLGSLNILAPIFVTLPQAGFDWVSILALTTLPIPLLASLYFALHSRVVAVGS